MSIRRRANAGSCSPETRSPLEPYSAGRAEADRLVAQLEDNLSGDSEASRRLNAVVSAARDWVAKAAEPQIAARRGTHTTGSARGDDADGQGLFDELRERQSALRKRTTEVAAHQFDRIRAAQRLALVAQSVLALLLLAG